MSEAEAMAPAAADVAENKAIMRIQAAMRGNVMRAELHRARFLRLMQASAAEKIQAIIRGKQTRAADKEELQKEAFARRDAFLQKKASTKRVLHEDDLKKAKLISSISTAQLRAELEELGVTPPDDAGRIKISVSFNERLAAVSLAQDRTLAWVPFFKATSDEAGVITFDELMHVTRKKFKFTTREMPDNTIKGLWVSLDSSDGQDDDNIKVTEFAKFMRLGGPGSLKAGKLDDRIAGIKKMKSTKVLERQAEVYNENVLNGFYSSVKTEKLKKDLIAKGEIIPMPEEEVQNLSQKFNDYLAKNKNIGSRGWLALFKEMDDDASGLINYDEIRTLVRKKLRIGPAELSDIKIQSLWCWLDDDNSDTVQQLEFSRFMAKAGPEALKAGADQRRQELLKKQAMMKRQQTNAHLDAEAHANRLFSSMKTTDMRANLEEIGLWPIPDDDVLSLSLRFNESLDAIPDGRTRGWIALFKEMDDDESGVATYDEIAALTRKKLKISKKELSESKLQALWCWLDDDDSDRIEQVEFSRFMAKAGPERLKHGAQEARLEMLKIKAAEKREAVKKAADADLSLNKLVSSIATLDMRSELEEAGVPVPDGDKLDALSSMFNRYVDEAMPTSKSSCKWFMIFKQIDDDASGLITFDELSELVRRKKLLGGLGIPKSELNDQTLKSLWCVLDADDSDRLDTIEFGNFMKRKGTGTTRKGAAHAREELVKKKNLQKRAEADAEAQKELLLDGLHSSIITEDTRRHLEEEGVTLPDKKELEELSQMFNNALEYKDGGGNLVRIPWIQMFREVDNDASGLLTYDEIRTVIRHKMKIKSDKLPEEKMRALWCVLDADNSNTLASVEFGRFMSIRGPSVLKKDQASTRRDMLAERNKAKAKAEEDNAYQEMVLNGFVGKLSTLDMRNDLAARGIVSAAASDSNAGLAPSAPNARSRRRAPCTMCARANNWQDPLNEEDQKAFAIQLSTQVDKMRPGKDKHAAWFQLFKEVDDDASGLLTFDELRTVVRKTLKLTKKDYPEDKLKALWLALDVDNSNNLNLVEFLKFVHKGDKTQEKKKETQAKMASPKIRRKSPPGETGGWMGVDIVPGKRPTPKRTSLTTMDRYDVWLRKWPTKPHNQGIHPNGGFPFLADPFHNCIFPPSSAASRLSTPLATSRTGTPSMPSRPSTSPGFTTAPRGGSGSASARSAAAETPAQWPTPPHTPRSPRPVFYTPWRSRRFDPSFMARANVPN